MPRKPDPTNMRIAQFSGRAAAIQAAVRVADPAAIAASREQLPRLWEAIDALIELVDWR